MGGGRPSRTHLLFWLLFASFALAALALLFFSEPLFLRETGAKASLTAEARKWRGAPRAAIMKSAGEALARYLGASRPVSGAVVRVSEATSDRLSIEVRLPWAEVSARKRRQRAGLACRLGADMLEAAGARDASLLVSLRRTRKDASASDPAGAMAYSPKSGKCEWKE